MSLSLGPGSLDQIMAYYTISNIPRFTTTPHHRILFIPQQLDGLDDISITPLPPRSFSIEKCSWRQSCQLRSLGPPPLLMLPPGVLLIIDSPICLLYLTNLWLTQCLSFKQFLHKFINLERLFFSSLECPFQLHQWFLLHYFQVARAECIHWHQR